MQLWFSYASCGILLILEQGYTDQTCVMSKVFVNFSCETSANKKMRKGKEPGYDCIEIWLPSQIQRE